MPACFAHAHVHCRCCCADASVSPDKITVLTKSAVFHRIFTEEAELTNSRAAMAAMGVFIVTASLFT